MRPTLDDPSSSGLPIALDDVSIIHEPFPHFIAEDVLEESVADALLAWAESDAVWKLQAIEGFYESYNLDFKPAAVPRSLEVLRDPSLLEYLRARVASVFGREMLPKVDIEMHKMTPGQAIRVHNDYGPVGQTHRILIQINRGWERESGGFLMFFDSDRLDAASVPRRIYLPLSRSSVTFEISPRSHHAVSEVHGRERLTLVYSFYAADGYSRYRLGEA